MVTAGLPKLTQIKVNEIDVTAYCRPSACKDGENDNEPSSFNLTLVRAAETVLGPLQRDTMIGKSVTFSRGIASATEEWCFRGEVTSFSPDGRLVVLGCRDKMWRAVKKIETNVYQAADSTLGNPKLIYTDLMERARVPVTAALIQDPGAAYTINKFIVDTANVKERADNLVKRLPNWRHYYDPQEDSARLEPVQYEDSGLILTVGIDVLDLPRWKNDGEKLVQTLTVRGATQLALTTNTRSGDGTSTEFTIDEEPESIKVEVGGVELVPGVLGVTASGTYDYYVDKVARKIIFLSPPANAVDNILVTFQYKQERPVTVVNPGSIAKYSTQGTEQYPYEDVVHSLDSLDIEDARLYGDGILAQDSEVSPVTELRVKGYSGLRRNMRITVFDPKSGVNETAYIRSIEKSYPYGYDLVYVNRKAPDEMVTIGNMYNRIQRLEENASRGSKVVFVTKPVGRRVGVGRRQLKKTTRTWTPGYTGFVFGSTKYGIIGVSGFDANIYGTSWYPLKSSANDSYSLINGTPTAITYAPKNGLLSAAFNGTSSRINFGASSSLITDNTAWSVAVRVNADIAATNDRVLTLFSSPANSGIRIYNSSTGILALGYRNSGGTLNDMYTHPINVDTWYHAVLTYDGTTYSAYIDGVLMDTAVDTFAGLGTSDAYVGEGGGNYWDGNICDLRIYDGYTLSADEVAALYNNGVPRDEDELFFSGRTTNWLAPAENIHREYLTSTDGVYDGYTTATIDTNALTATASGGTKTLVLGPVSVGPTVSRIKVTLNFTGTLTSVSVGADPSGAGAESLGTFVSGQMKTVTLATPLTTIYLIVVMASGAVISTPLNAYDVATAPAMRLVLDSYT